MEPACPSVLSLVQRAHGGTQRSSGRLTGSAASPRRRLLTLAELDRLDRLEEVEAEHVEAHTIWRNRDACADQMRRAGGLLFAGGIPAEDKALFESVFWLDAELPYCNGKPHYSTDSGGHLYHSDPEL